MDWRCEWCGKPHETDDPPCDNCGHGKFEKAVVQQTDLGEEGLDSTKLWVCTECGREHTKHSPPCSRCGAPELELRETRVEDAELTAPGYLDLVTPKYAVAFVLTIALVVYFVVGLTGLANVPGFPSDGPPEVTAPGNESSFGSVPLASVERAYLDGYNEWRANAGSERLRRRGGIDDVTRYHNKRWVRAEYGDGTRPTGQELGELLHRQCERQVEFIAFRHDGDRDANAEELAAAMLEEHVGPDSRGLDHPGRVTGVDIHATPDGRLFVTQIIC